MVFFRIDTQLCQQCGGRCCQGHPGAWSDPERFFSIFTATQPPSADELIATLLKHRLTLHNLDGILIPAPRSIEQGCAELLALGCSYPPQTRPCQCLALIPELETLVDDQIHCHLPAGHGSGAARDNWRPYQELLQQVQAAIRQSS